MFEQAIPQSMARGEESIREGADVPHTMRFETAQEQTSSNGDIMRMQLETLTLTASDTATPATAEAQPKSRSWSSPERRPWDDLRSAGPAANPIPFPSPVFQWGRRASVCYYNKVTKRIYPAKGVLFRDFSREYGTEDGGLHRVERAYYPVPFKETISTIMGHVEICHVLTRCLKHTESDDENDDSDSDDDDDEEEEDDIVFQMTNQYVAVKVNYCDRMQKMKNKHAEDPRKEVSAMQLIGNEHPHVLGCLEVLFDGKSNELNVVMPYCGSGDLFTFLQKMPKLPEPKARYWFRQIVAGVRHLQHTVGICHRDLSPENIMIDKQNSLIIDMGMCIRMPYSTRNGPPDTVTDISQGTRRRLLKRQGACGKLPYMSPEIFRNQDDFDGEAVDVWTMGTILFCMLSGNRSYERPHESDPQFYWMTRGLVNLLKDWGVVLTDEAVDLLTGMLQVDPRLRLSLEEVANHSWFDHVDEAV